MKRASRAGCCGFPVTHDQYFRTFPVIEIQKTFYQPPLPRTAERWRQEAPEGFEFTLKAWQLITHEASSPTYRRLRKELSPAQKRQVGGFRWTGPVRRAWSETLEIARRLAADKVVFQCPRSFLPTDENKDRFRKFFESIDRDGLTCIWEPRGEWSNPEIQSLCRELDLVHCVDPFDATPATSGLRYYRLHGIGGYRHRYRKSELEELGELVMKRTPVYFMFNNQSMYEDARRFERMMGRLVGT